MSHLTQKPRPAADQGSLGLPTWAGIVIVIAALLTGLLISVFNANIGAPYVSAFVIGGIVVALFTQPRGLYLTVAAMPVSFAVVTVATSWIITRAGSPNSGAFSLTTIASTVFPLLQLFPVLFLVTVGSIAIAVLRLWLLRRGAQYTRRAEADTRRRTAQAQRRTRQEINSWRDAQEASPRWRWPEEERQPRQPRDQREPREPREPRDQRDPREPAARPARADRAGRADRTDRADRIDRSDRRRARVEPPRPPEPVSRREPPVQRGEKSVTVEELMARNRQRRPRRRY